MNHINKNKAGLALGAIIGGFHLIWSILIAMGLAQSLLNFILKLHMIRVTFAIESFNAGIALVLIIITTIVGYVVGYSFAFVWNKIHK